MSQLLDVKICCPGCGQQYDAKLFRTVWGEHESMRNKVMSDDINILTCPHCGHSFHAPFAMLYVDADAKFAVWYDPTNDPSIDEMTQGFSRMLGKGNYYENAPRIQDWYEFKKTVNRYYSGELKGQSEEVTKLQQEHFTKIAGELGKKKNSGCMSVIVAVVIASATLIAIL